MRSVVAYCHTVPFEMTNTDIVKEDLFDLGVVKFDDFVEDYHTLILAHTYSSQYT